MRGTTPPQAPIPTVSKPTVPITLKPLPTITPPTKPPPTFTLTKPPTPTKVQEATVSADNPETEQVALYSQTFGSFMDWGGELGPLDFLPDHCNSDTFPPTGGGKKKRSKKRKKKLT